MDINQTLGERKTTHGPYAPNTETVQKLKEVMRDTPNWKDLKPHQKESLDMIAHKLGRILHGNPDFHDHWHDIIGFTKLTADLLVKP